MKRDDFRYVEMAGLLRTEIMSGYLRPGQYLLPEKELCQKYAISRNSLRQALELLTEEGLLVKMRGRGNKVADQLPAEPYGTNTLVVLSPYRSAFAEDALPILISLFKQQFPKVEVKLLYTGYLIENIMHDLTGLGLKPDIVLAWDRHFAEFESRDFVPVDDLISELSDIPEKLIGTFRKNEQLYAVPATYSPIFLACNPRLFESAGIHMPIEGWSLEQFVQAAKELTRDDDRDGMNETYGFGLSSSIIRWPVLAMKYSYNKRSHANRSVYLPADGLRDALDFMRNLIYKERICPVTEVGDWAFLNELFEDGQLAMILTTTLATNMKRQQFPVRMLPLPKRSGGSKGSLLIANGLMISRLSPNMDLAKRFLRFAADIEFQKRMARETGFLSIYDSVNRAVWSPYERNALGIHADHLEESHFIFDLFPNLGKPQEMERSMKKFWAGLESSEQLVNRLFQ
ncbi:extracellular solute-binding protein [Paenibacillus nasutitermitis]|uniref:HTH gntR-type domain-containing protein n=1 Tax=Paenibacillus nasutitermitis TaxID=1652958 RepID=A0A916ZDY0_9BACL|nr:extracellular solute-binding protein [Paenibacillus nasutitermitis]GGD88707.1 hypothetical protein GCM10010911_54110 [Paenibacillus nasutitermitis]